MKSRTQCVLKTEESPEHAPDILIIQKSTRGRDKTHRKAVAREIGGKTGHPGKGQQQVKRGSRHHVE